MVYDFLLCCYGVAGAEVKARSDHRGSHRRKVGTCGLLVQGAHAEIAWVVCNLSKGVWLVEACGCGRGRGDGRPPA